VVADEHVDSAVLDVGLEVEALLARGEGVLDRVHAGLVRGDRDPVGVALLDVGGLEPARE
jgi:hypothetical protein